MSRPFHSNEGDYVPKHVVHNTSSGCRYVGEFGSISIDLCSGLARYHDGVTPGGKYVSTLIENCSGNLPIPPVTPPAEVTMAANSGTICVTHNFARKPVVQVLDAATGTVDTIEITHTSDNQFCVSANAPHPAYTIVYRF